MKTSFNIAVSVILIALLLVQASAFSSPVRAAAAAGERTSLIILVQDRVDESAAKPYLRALSSVGLNLQVMSVSETIDWSKTKLVIVPEATAASLPPQLQDSLAAETRQGLGLVMEGPSDLAAKLGVKVQSGTVGIRDIADQAHLSTAIHWKEQLTMRLFSIENGRTFVSDKTSGSPILSGGQAGSGRFLYLGVPLDARDAWGFDRFPFFHDTLTGYFGIQPNVRIDGLSAFIDWGYYYDQDPVQLAEKLKSMGIRKVFLSSWYDRHLVSDYYKKFIHSAHVNGLLVYSWYEFPMVSKGFWDAHPEWRQKTAAGGEAHIDWRYLMALEIPECLEAVKEVIRQDLTAYDWDGVNLAELYFESPNTAFGDKASITPMSGAFRASFQAQYGTDPLELFTEGSANHRTKNDALFQSYVKERTRLITKHHGELLDFISKGTWPRPLELLLTNVDTAIETHMEAEIGVDMEELTAIASQYKATVIVEDPFTLWSQGPERYRTMAETHQKTLASAGSLSLDINVVDRADQGERPTKRQTGLEFTTLIAEGAKHFRPVAVYESRVGDADKYKYAPYALGSTVKVTPLSQTDLRVEAPSTFVYEIGGGTGMLYEATVDGSAWPAGGPDGVLLPRGSYTVKLAPRAAEDSRLWLTSFNGEVLDAGRTAGGLTLSYDEKHLVSAELNARPKTVLVNGQPVQPTIYYRSGVFVVELPAGKNTVEFAGGSDEVSVSLNGKLVPFTEPAVIRSGTALYALSDLLRALGAPYQWNAEHRSVEASLGGYAIWAQIDNPAARANGSDVSLEVPPQIINDRTMVPIRFVCEGFNLSVDWDAPTRTIIVKSK
ncbi:MULTISPECIES: stalk domain-containing protein [Paenibacillus]|uniref:stalk domain-containing protein n=1 Tax=Paenibacillus TaxID=44249 RepID=UPI0022B908E3|nr:stalk domain-containing protein [Paenibacillus caseinilyticus]MCZ8522047.1 stalk domain-containing protein [Paenibacillus caseinilyticus]